MSHHKINLLVSNVTKAVEDEAGIRISGYASTSSTDRQGDKILSSAWDLTNFKKNPILLFNHDYGAPVGRVTSISATDQGLQIEGIISPHSKIYGLVKDEVLSALSIGALIKDAQYDQSEDVLVITAVELLEISVVSVPANPTASFSVRKSFETDKAFEKFQEEYLALEEKITMNEDEIKALVATATTEAFQKALDAQAAAKAAEEAKAAEAEAVTKVASQAATAAVKTNTEELLSTIEAKLAEKDVNINKILAEHKEELTAKQNEILALQTNKRNYGNGSRGDWTANKGIMDEAKDALILRAIVKGAKEVSDTKYGREVLQKVNTYTGVEVASDHFETEVSTQIEQDIQYDLVLKPLFSELQLNAGTLVLPILPDAGYAELYNSAGLSAAGVAPKGNLSERGDAHGAPYGGVQMQEVILNTFKLTSFSFLGNETEEDAILPIMPLIRESIVRQQARGTENFILAGNSSQGVYTTGAHDGLIKLADSGGRYTETATATTKIDALAMMQMRRGMGKYGTNPRDVVYVVSEAAYYDLLEDPEYMDVNLVGNQNATKLTGEVGRIYGSPVLLCDEFAAPGAGNYTAVALNARNFVIPRQRGITFEVDYDPRSQDTALICTQRIGFKEKIPGARHVHGLRYKI